MQFISAIAIVADIIGAEKLRKLGESLRRSFPTDSAKQHLLKTTQWLGEIYEGLLIEFEEKELRDKFIFGEISNEEYEPRASLLAQRSKLDPYKRQQEENFISHLERIFKRSSFDKLNVFCSLAISIIYGIPWGIEAYSFFVDVFISGIPNLILLYYLITLIIPFIMIDIVFFVSLMFVSPVVVSAILFLLSFSVLFFDFLVIRRTAWLLERPKVESWFKIISLIFLLVGFHFDLLSS